MFAFILGIIAIGILVYFQKVKNEILDSEKFQQAVQTITEIQTMVSKYRIYGEHIYLTRDEAYYECTLMDAEFLYATNPNISCDYHTYKKECLERVFFFKGYPNIDEDEFVKGMWIQELPPDDIDGTVFRYYVVRYKFANSTEFTPNAIDLLRKKTKINT